MTTFDLKQVNKVAETVNAEMDQCGHGEGVNCATIETIVTCYANGCCSFMQQFRKWTNDVFAGRVAHNEQAERSWQLELTKLRDRAMQLANYVTQAESMCHSLDEENRLCAVIYDMDWILQNWVSPKLAVGPSARRVLKPELVEAARRRVAALKPLPKDWKPYGEDQQKMYQKLRSVTKSKNG